MLISHPKEVLVVPRESFDEICAVGLPRLKLERNPPRKWKFLPAKKGQIPQKMSGEAKLLELTDGLRLREWYQDKDCYRCAIALASITKSEAATEDICKELAEKEYRRASFTEAMYYFRELAKDKVNLGYVFHLGTHLPDKKDLFLWTIVTIGYDKIKAEKIFPKKPFKAGEQLVVVKEEKKTTKKG